MKRQKESILWSITPSDDNGPTSYLFGTMHVRDRRAFIHLEHACRYIDACDIFAAEFDFSEMPTAAMELIWVLPENLSLQQLLSRSAWKNLDFYSRKKLGAPAEALQKVHPIQVQVMLTEALLSNEAEHSLDETLWLYAQSQGKPTTGIETFEEQLNLLRSLPLQPCAKSLTWLLKNYRRQRQRLKKMMQWYEQGQLRLLYQAARRDARHLRRPLLLQRNERMAERIAAIACQKSLFCAVGAAHLAGGKGLLRLLKRAGFRVKPVLAP